LVDLNSVIKAHLVTCADLADLISNRVYSARDVPPPGYDLDSGACVTFRVRGGDIDYPDALHRPSVQFKCYGQNDREAWQVYRALYDALQNTHSASILHAQLEVQGQSLEEPETDWPFVLTYFRFLIRES